MPVKLGDVFADLSFGNLAGTSIGMNGVGTIDPEQQTRVIVLINHALEHLYTKFPIYKRELVLRVIEDRTLYPIMREHADTYTTEEGGDLPDKFIVDTEESPYLDDFIMLLKAQTLDDDGEKVAVPINDDDSTLSIYTPSYDVIQIVEATAGDLYNIVYQASHPVLGLGDLNQAVWLPHILRNALLDFVSAKIFNAMGGTENLARAGLLMASYNDICNEVLNKDIGHLSNFSNTSKLEDRGFA